MNAPETLRSLITKLEALAAEHGDETPVFIFDGVADTEVQVSDVLELQGDHPDEVSGVIIQ